MTKSTTLRVVLQTDDISDLIFVASAVRYLSDRPELQDAWLLYGDPATVRVPIKRTKSGFSLYIQRIEE